MLMQIYLDLFATILINVCCIFFCRVHPSKDWVWSQIPEIVRCGVEGLGDGNDIDDMDAEAFMQAYVNIVAGACISLGKLLIVLCIHFVVNLNLKNYFYINGYHMTEIIYLHPIRI